MTGSTVVRQGQGSKLYTLASELSRLGLPEKTKPSVNEILKAAKLLETRGTIFAGEKFSQVEEKSNHMKKKSNSPATEITLWGRIYRSALDLSEHNLPSDAKALVEGILALCNGNIIEVTTTNVCCRETLWEK